MHSRTVMDKGDTKQRQKEELVRSESQPFANKRQKMKHKRKYYHNALTGCDGQRSRKFGGEIEIVIV